MKRATRHLSLCIVSAVLSLWAFAAPVRSAEPDQRCANLSSADFSLIPDAPTQVLTSELKSGLAGKPAHCELHGYVSPQVGFAMRLPATQWNGKLLMVGCGGWCGTYDYWLENCTPFLRRGYACVATDMGHKGTVFDAKWAYQNLQAEIDFAFRATHVTALAAKALTQAFYASAPRYSYFMGCSQGGRQAMKSAQDFAADFDGIIAGAPLLGGVSGMLWPSRAITDADGKSILSAADTKLLHGAVLAQCDRNDTARDGVLDEPRQCSFDPAVLRCSSADDAQCLGDAQLAAVNKTYAGAPGFGGFEKGSELNWGNDIFGMGRIFDPATGEPEFALADVYRYLAFYPDPGPSWSPRDFDFQRDPPRMAQFESLLDARNPDLRRFKAHGGKLILYHGWNDTSIHPAPTLDYFETATRTMGGRTATEDFFRLFMIPGGSHCMGGEGAFAVDYLRALEAWVERGVPPDQLTGFRLSDPASQYVMFHDIDPEQPGAAELTRTYRPYTLQPKDGLRRAR